MRSNALTSTRDLQNHGKMFIDASFLNKLVVLNAYMITPGRIEL